MKNILGNLFLGNIREALRPVEKLLQTKESKARIETYEKLEALLNEEQKEALEQHMEKEMEWISLQEQHLYEKAFKTGVWLGLELADFKPEYWEE